MSSAPPADAPLADQDGPGGSWRSSRLVRCLGAAVLIWILALAAITWHTANPDIINPAQIAESDLVFVGRCTDPAQGTFQVERELKRGQLSGPVTVQDWPQQLPPRTAAWVVPVLRHGKSFVVTTGDYRLPPDKALNPEGVREMHVAAKVYPATDDVLRQIELLLNDPPAPPQ